MSTYICHIIKWDKNIYIRFFSTFATRYGRNRWLSQAKGFCHLGITKPRRTTLPSTVTPLNFSCSLGVNRMSCWWGVVVVLTCFHALAQGKSQLSFSFFPFYFPPESHTCKEIILTLTFISCFFCEVPSLILLAGRCDEERESKEKRRNEGWGDGVFSCVTPWLSSCLPLSS